MAKTLKDFLNERQLGPMVVKNPDEQKFIDKHVVAKTADRNGNDDELFKGSKVKMADRPKHRKGYNPGEDEEVYEALKGAQHKIDANKNGKVDAHDFHLLRKKKKVAEAADDAKLAFQLHMAKKREELRKKGQLAKEEAEQIDELSIGTMKSYGDKRARTAFSGGRKPGQSVDAGIKMKSKQSNSLSLARTKINRARDTGSTVLNKEEIEQIDELSKKTLGSYVKKAGVNRTHIAGKQKSVDDAMTGVSAAMRYVSDTDNLDKSRSQLKKVSNRLDNKDFNRQQGISKAVDRLTKEEAEQIDELSPSTMGSYAKKASADFTARKPKMGYDGQLKKMQNRRVGVNRALDKMYGEEAEQIDELSHDTLRRYRMKAKSIGDNEKSDINYRAKGRELAGRKTHGGQWGIPKAKVMAKEEADLEEKLNMDKASMGTVIKDFQKSDAPQFMGKSQKKRQVMAVAAKLTAERGKLPMNKEQRLLVKLDDLAEVHKRTMVSVFEKLNEDNQYAFMQACDTAEGIEQMLDFSISYRGE